MPVRYQKFITRQDLRNNPDVLYVFGDNLQRRGYGGQAGAMRGEPNAVGIPTKRKPTMDEDAFFKDEDWAEVAAAAEPSFRMLEEHLDAGGVVVVPKDGIGTGLSQLPQRAPEIHEYIVAILRDIEKKHTG